MTTEEQTINGKEGELILTTPDGNVKTLDITAFTATYTITKVTQGAVGRINAMSKATGASGAGTITAFYADLSFFNMMLEYQNNGKLPRFKLTGVNNDRASDVPARRVMLYGCTIDSLDIFKLDESTAFMTVDIPFTFDRFEHV